jgi:CRISPR/Cas system CSM-associated protein Csm3 (group 7 of RAMP superfamily)
MSPEAMDMSKKLGYRVLIEGTLTTRTFLHIGAGKPEKEVATARQEAQAARDPEAERKGVPLPVVTAGKKPIIPASALRGALRSRLKSLGLDKDLMGWAAETEGKGKARRLFVYDAVVDSCAPGLEFDDSDGHVDGIAMTAISRWRRAPQDTMLRNVLAVPPGVSFRVRIGLCGDPASPKDKREVTADEIAKVLAALGNGEWAAPGAGTLFKPLHLGAFQKAGWGELEWKTCKIVALTPDGLVHWLDGRQKPETGDQGWGLCKEKIESTSLVQPQLPGAGDNLIRLPLTLAFESTFFTADQRKRTREAIKAAHAEDQDKTPEKLARVMRVDGRAWLNGQSLKGALRSQFERILRTRGIYCCDPSLVEEDWSAEKKAQLHTGPRCKPIQSAADLGKLCFACQVFGNGGWASTIEVTPFEEINQCTMDTRREFLAISRFTGGGVPGLKFSADVAVRPKLEGTISINLQRLKHTYSLTDEEKKNGKKEPISADAKLGALLHLFRDFAEGDIPVGAGRSKGFGKFTVDLPLDCCDGIAEARPLILTLKGEHAEAAETEMGGRWLSTFDQMASSTAVSEAEWPSPGTPAAGASAPAERKQKGSYNPYHWVPAQEAPEELKTKLDEFGEQPAQRHDVYDAKAFSGEMVVTARAVTPIFVGGKRKSKGEVGKPAEVEPFTIGGAPAIPSTTLRGLLSSTYEIATASAMRVLETERIYSYRMAAGRDRPFDFIGKVTEDCEGVIPWARRPGKEVPGWTRTQPPEWVPVRFECVVPTDVLPNAYCLSMAVRDMPPETVRKHEIRFAGVPAHQNDRDDRIGISPTAKAQFHRLAEERWNVTRENTGYALQPYEPLGQQRGGKESRYLLKSGDFIYFERENGAAISRIALAQIWRDDVKKPLGELFGGKDLVPLQLDWKAPDAARKNLTMVETAFGFVWKEENKELRDPAKVKGRIPAFASKIVISDATVTGPYAAHALPGGPKALKVLSSPKPPSPAFYFDPVRSYLPTYKEIVNGSSKPRGRKLYLHLDWDKKGHPWESTAPPSGSGRDDQKAKELQTAVQCVREETPFTFTIAFDNLTKEEFLALCYTLRPEPHYRHKLGMGKPLGLGSVSLFADNIHKIDRPHRYTADGFGKGRFCDLAQAPANDWIDAYAKQWKNSLKANIDLWNSLTVLETIGTRKVKDLQYPMIHRSMPGKWNRQTDGEWELFKWPSANKQNAIRESGKDMAHAMLPIAVSAPDGDGAFEFPIPRTPAPCYAIVIKPQQANDIGQVREYTYRAIETAVVTSNEEAERKIMTLPTDAVVYLVRLGRDRVNFHGRCVRQVTLTSFDLPVGEDTKKLKCLMEAISLGARPSDVQSGHIA